MRVIQVMGLPGSGKSTLAKSLLNLLGWQRSFRIGTYHKQFSPTEAGDFEAWQAMFHDLERCGWTHFIFETTGLNPRWREVVDRRGKTNILTIKLECKLPELRRRISLKSLQDQAHGDWIPINRFQNKLEFVTSVFPEFMALPAEAVVETTAAPPEEVFDLVQRYLHARGKTTAS